MECRGEGIYSRQMEGDRGEEIVLHPPIMPFFHTVLVLISDDSL